MQGTDITGRPVEPPLYYLIDKPQPESQITITYGVDEPPSFVEMANAFVFWWKCHVFNVVYAGLRGFCAYIHFLPFVVLDIQLNLKPQPSASHTFFLFEVRRKPLPGFRGELTQTALKRSQRRWRFGY